MARDDDLAYQVLTQHIHDLSDQGIFIIVELTGTGITAWKIWRDETGTPDALGWPLRFPAPVDDPRQFFEHQLARIAADAPAGTIPRLIVIKSSRSAPADGLAEAVSAAYPGTPEPLTCDIATADMLPEVLRDAPLTRKYELVLLRETRSGRLLLECSPLFPRGAQRGYNAVLSIQCEPGGACGTAFVVVASTGGTFKPISVHSASLPSGRYQLEATLRRPGLVKFDGLPKRLRSDSRLWAELVASVPLAIDRSPAAHLICAIEVSGGNDRVRNRIDRLEQLIACAAGADARLVVSLVTYGVHPFLRKANAQPATVAVRAVAGERALDALDRLRGSGLGGQVSDPHGAQIECALRVINSQLTEIGGKPVLVTASGRPPYPPTIDRNARQIFPCPARVDWEQEWRQLRLRSAGMSFGAIHDPDANLELDIWRRLGATDLAPVDVADMEQFAATLGLWRPAQPVPFPLAAQEIRS